MSTRVSVYIATSLDGFIARKEGELDVLDEANAAVPAGEDFGYRAFMDTIDALVMVRYTYEKVMSFGEWPYGSTPALCRATLHKQLSPQGMVRIFPSPGVYPRITRRRSTVLRMHLRHGDQCANFLYYFGTM